MLLDKGAVCLYDRGDLLFLAIWSLTHHRGICSGGTAMDVDFCELGRLMASSQVQAHTIPVPLIAFGTAG